MLQSLQEITRVGYECLRYMAARCILLLYVSLDDNYHDSRHSLRQYSNHRTGLLAWADRNSDNYLEYSHTFHTVRTADRYTHIDFIERMNRRWGP